MEQHKGYWISGSVIPGPPNTTHWEFLGIVLKPGHSGSVIEVARVLLGSFRLELPELAECFGVELCRIALDECLTQ